MLDVIPSQIHLIFRQKQSIMYIQSLEILRINYYIPSLFMIKFEILLCTALCLLSTPCLQIVDIPKKTFPKLYELHTIDFSHNNLSTIERSVFVNLLSLRNLNFTHNHLEVIEVGTYQAQYLPTMYNVHTLFCISIGTPPTFDWKPHFRKDQSLKVWSKTIHYSAS